MLEVSGCLTNEKETSVGETGEMYDSAKCMWWLRKKQWKVWACQLSKQKIISVCKNEKKKKCIDTTKIRVDIVLGRKIKNLKE